MKQYDAYLFDWDGTIAQTLHAWMKIIRQCYEHFGLHPTEKDLVKSLGRVPQTALDLGLDPSRMDEFMEHFERVHDKVLDAELYPDIRKVLNRLKTLDKHVVVITATFRQTLHRFLTINKLSKTVDLVIAAEDVATHKPHPEGLELALRKLSVSKGKAIMIGDSEKDLGAAQNAGIDSLLFYPDTHQSIHDLAFLREHKPTYTIHSWRELLDQLQ
jgi:HAD superfamily hydrolase (TIGR01549 family)